MRIFLTGANGFVGSHLLPRLLDRQQDVAILHLPGSDDWRIREHVPAVRVIEGDLAHPASLRNELADFAPNAVIHLAWFGVLGGARNHPGQARNLPAAVELVELAHEVGAVHFVGLGSQAEYGPHSARLDEHCETRPTTLYGIAKLAAGLSTARLCEQWGMRHAWLRLFSSYGPKDDPAWMVPQVVLELLRGNRPSLTAGQQRWDYAYVGDVAAAICAVALEPTASGFFNLGSGRACSLRSIVEQIRDAIDPTLPLGFGEIAYRPDQVMHLEADITRLQQATSWSPSISLGDGIAQTVRWYREHRSRYPDP